MKEILSKILFWLFLLGMTTLFIAVTVGAILAVILALKWLALRLM